MDFKKVTSLFPFFYCLPSWLKIIFLLWIVITLIVLGLVIFYNYQHFTKSQSDKNNPAELMKERRKNAISLIREMEDYRNVLQDIYQSFLKDREEKSTVFNAKNIFRSGAHAKALGELFKNYSSKVEDEKRRLTRDLEDFLFYMESNSLDTLLDESTEKEGLISEYALCEQKKHEILSNMKNVVKSMWEKIDLREVDIKAREKQYFSEE